MTVFYRTQTLSRILYSLVMIISIFAPLTLNAQLNQEPDEIKDVGVDEHLDAVIPTNVSFTNEKEKTVQFKDLITGDKPVILNLAYYSCPMLCGLIWEGMAESLRSIPLTVGKDFDVITLSIDPLETPQLAGIKKQKMLKEYGRPEARSGWHYLTGKEENIKKITDAVGYKFKWVKDRKEYAHPAALVILTPEGHISRYLYGIQFDPQTLRLSLVEASQGKVGSTMDQIILTCFQYDPTTNQYAPVAMNIMRLGGGLTLLALGLFLGGFWLKEIRKKKKRLVEGYSS